MDLVPIKQSTVFVNLPGSCPHIRLFFSLPLPTISYPQRRLVGVSATISVLGQPSSSCNTAIPLGKRNPVSTLTTPSFVTQYTQPNGSWKFKNTIATKMA